MLEAALLEQQFELELRTRARCERLCKAVNALVELQPLARDCCALHAKCSHFDVPRQTYVYFR